MSGQQTHLVRTFMTHDMPDADVLALSTGREAEFKRIMAAVARSRKAAPGTLQHAVVYGSRGFGKSFMMRRVEIEVARAKAAAVPVVLLPEEQHNLYDRPHALLDTIARRLQDLASGRDDSFGEGHYLWPKRGEEARLWQEKEVAVEAALDTLLPKKRGLAIVIIENFDILLSTLFRDSEDEQRLRAWLDRPGNRLMLLATATGAVDIDYDRPLFQAFVPVRLSPWSGDDCIAYFNRLRAHEGKSPLGAEQEAKARAVADFIGGTPRIARLLAEVLETEEALTVTDTMTALADRLAEYYRRRIEDLPPRARGLLDALIRGGEPASQTELAERVGAGGQSDIAQVMTELKRADILRGTRAPKGRSTLYRVTDRVFAHYFRLRQGSREAQQTPLATILDFLKGFYTRDEQRREALRHLDAGRIPEAGLFTQLALEGGAPEKNYYTFDFPARLQRWLRAIPDALETGIENFNDLVSLKPEELYGRFSKGPDTPASKAVRAAICAWAACRMGQIDRGRNLLTSAWEEEGADSTTRIITGMELIYFLSYVDAEVRKPVNMGLQLGENTFATDVAALDAARLNVASWANGRSGRFKEAVSFAEAAQRRAVEAGDPGLEAVAFREKAFALGALDKHDEAIEAAKTAQERAREAGDLREEAIALRYQAFSLVDVGRHDEAAKTAKVAADHAREAGDLREEAIALTDQAHVLGTLGRQEEAVAAAKTAQQRAREAGDLLQEAIALRHQAFSLGSLGRHEEALVAASTASDGARDAGDLVEEAEALRWLAMSLLALKDDKKAYVTFQAAREKARSIKYVFTWSRALSRLIELALTFEPAAVPAMFEELHEAWDLDPKESASPAVAVANASVAAATGGDREAFEAYLAQKGEALQKFDEPVYYFSANGEDLAGFANANCRAVSEEAMAWLLPRIAALMADLPEEKRDPIWLSDLLSGFAKDCSDPGLLRDVAALVTDDLAEDAETYAALLTVLADVDESDNPETVLATADPDVVTLIRRLRDLPEPEPEGPKRKSGRRKKMGS